MLRIITILICLVASACQVGAIRPLFVEKLEVTVTYQGMQSNEGMADLYPALGIAEITSSNDLAAVQVSGVVHRSCESSRFYSEELQKRKEIIRGWMGITRQTISEELQLKSPPQINVMLVELPDQRPIEISTSCDIQTGITIGFPLRQTGPLLEEAQLLVFGVAHEYVEALLAMPPIAGCNLYGSSKNNRWFGEGVANAVAARCLHACGLPPIEWGQNEGVLVDFENWFTGGEAPGGETHTYYWAAMAEVESWLNKARANGATYPLSDIIEWLRAKKGGPSYAELRSQLYLGLSQK